MRPAGAGPFPCFHKPREGRAKPAILTRRGLHPCPGAPPGVNRARRRAFGAGLLHCKNARCGRRASPRSSQARKGGRHERASPTAPSRPTPHRRPRTFPDMVAPETARFAGHVLAGPGPRRRSPSPCRGRRARLLHLGRPRRPDRGRAARLRGPDRRERGAMNAVVMVDGWVKGGPDGAREALEQFWREVSLDGDLGPTSATWSRACSTCEGQPRRRVLAQGADAEPLRVEPAQHQPAAQGPGEAGGFRAPARCADGGGTCRPPMSGPASSPCSSATPSPSIT